MKTLITIAATVIGLSSTVMAQGANKTYHSRTAKVKSTYISPATLVRVIIGYDNYRRPVYGYRSVARSNNYYRGNSNSRASYVRSSRGGYKCRY